MVDSFLLSWDLRAESYSAPGNFAKGQCHLTEKTVLDSAKLDDDKAVTFNLLRKGK